MRIVKNILIVVIVVVVGWNSIYFAKLDDVKASKAGKEFDAVKYANTFWNSKLLPNADKAVDLDQLLSLLATDQAKTFETYSRALGIGNLRYFLVKGTGKVHQVESDYIILDKNIRIATEFIFGNAV